MFNVVRENRAVAALLVLALYTLFYFSVTLHHHALPSSGSSQCESGSCAVSHQAELPTGISATHAQVSDQSNHKPCFLCLLASALFAVFIVLLFALCAVHIDLWLHFHKHSVLQIFQANFFRLRAPPAAI